MYSQNQMPRGSGLKFYDVKNYSDITFPTHPHEYTQKVCFTDV